MRLFIAIICFGLTYHSCLAQNTPLFSETQFEKQIMNFSPQQGQLSTKDFDYANMILTEVKKAIKNDSEGFNRADYFNVLSAFLTLKMNKEEIQLAFNKFKNSEGSCEYFTSERIFRSTKYDALRPDIEKQKSICNGKSEKPKPFIAQEYAQKNKLSPDLISIIAQIDQDDRKYRVNEKVDWNQQNALDLKNQQLIDSLFLVHKKYLGRSIVGEKFETTMWAVIQHSNAAMMEKYLPILQKAVAEKQLDSGPFKMTIDRFYGLKYGYQVFGSQSGFGFELADEATRQKVMEQYNIK